MDNGGKVLLIFFGIAIFCIALDQWTKYLAAAFLRPIGYMELWPGVFRLYYTENTGAAFSMLQGQRWLLLALTGAALIVLVVYRVRKKRVHPLLNISLAMLLGGGVGNLIDRALRGVVIDFFDFTLINFAIFNVADIFVSVGAVLLAIYVLFIADKEARRGDSHTGIA